MKAVDFIEEWNRTHTSSPSFQDAIEWARKQTIENAKNAFNSACGWLSYFPWYDEVFEDFTNRIEE